MATIIRLFTQGCAALATLAGSFLLLSIFFTSDNSAFQETALATTATAFFVLAVLAIAVTGVSHLRNVEQLLKHINERDKEFKQWQAHQSNLVNMADQNEIQYPPGGRLDQ